MRILIVGSGAIGTFTGGVLLGCGQEVSFLDLPPVIQSIREKGIEVQGLKQPVLVKNIKGVSDVTGLDPFDIAVIAVKSYSTFAAIKKLDKKMASRVLTFQNGLGNEEILSEKFGKNKVVAGSITYPVTFLEPGRVRIENQKAGIGLAPVNAGVDIRDLVDLFKKSSLNVVTACDYRSLKWSKILLNLVCNATCAILGMMPDKVFSVRGLVRIEREQMLEALRVMKRNKIPLMDLPGYPVKKMAMVYRLSPPSVLKLLLHSRIAMGRGKKKPSLLIEVERKTGKSEVGFLNGAVYKQAFSAALKAPVNKILYETLSDIVSGSIPWSDFRGKPESFINLFKFK